MEEEKKKKDKPLWPKVLLGILIAIVAYFFIYKFLGMLKGHSIHTEKFLFNPN